MPLPKGNQIVAARGLLGWDQKDIADRVGITVAAISKIEKGDNKGKISTLEKIETVFELAGIEFIENEGVQKKQNAVKILRGHEAFCSFYDDVYTTAKDNPAADICVTNVNEVDYVRWHGEYCEIHDARMLKLGVNVRVLLKENDRYLQAPFCKYRWVKESQFADTSMYLYGDKSAFIQFSNEDVVVTLVENPSVTQSMRKLFAVMWDNAMEITD